jgi:PAS domain S-box-containing protein
LWISRDKPGVYSTEDAFLLNEVAVNIALTLANQVAAQRIRELQQRLDERGQDGKGGFHEIANTSAIGIVQWEGGGRFSKPNDAFLRMIGRTREEMQMIRDCSELTPPEFHHLLNRAEQELGELGVCQPFETEFFRQDGSRIPVLVSAGLPYNRCPPWLAFVMSLQERRSFSATPPPPKRRRAAHLIQVPGHEGEDIAADSAAMRKILRDLERVAPTNATMLLLGETGTGKEVLAHTISQMSHRRDFPFVKVNCAAIPAGLLESELFGHERGAFTGAQGRKIGRLELAHQGTIFLDEVGDLPLELQPKLLRVLQERAFERLGGTQTIKVDVRLIAATNRDLAQMTASGQFRSDLFYRLNVFPVRVPPLRERPESVPLLANLFVQKFARRMKRPHLTIPPETMAALERWIWPGNIRELENLIERAVILSPGPELRVNLDEMRFVQPDATPPGQQTLCDVEREHIRHVLHDTNGVIGGKHGAASRLGLKRTTLQYKMKKLEISRH